MTGQPARVRRRRRRPRAARAIVLLLLGGVAVGCSQPVRQKKTQTAPPAEAEVQVVPPVPDLLRRAARAIEAGRRARAREQLALIFNTAPDHLEARVLAAMAGEADADSGRADELWQRVERILIRKGKLVPFVLQRPLFAAARHYAQAGRRRRAELFLEELWRRFPSSSWSSRARLMVATQAYAQHRWEDVLAACKDLRKIHPAHRANQRCARLSHGARRLRRLGPPPAEGAAKWQWEAPLPQGNALHGIWLGPHGTQLLVGAGGTILQRGRRDRRYRLLTSPTRWSLRSIDGVAPHSVYAVGDGGIVLSFDGSSWKVIRAAAPDHADLSAVVALGPDSFVAVGGDGAVVEREGGKIREKHPSKVDLHGVWGTAGGPLFAVGDSGTMLVRSPGKAWRSISSDAYEHLRGVDGLDGSHVVAVGDRRTVVYFDGEKSKESVQGLSALRSVWVHDRLRAWAVGRGGHIIHRDGRPLSTWRVEKTSTAAELRAVAGRSPRQVVAAGAGGTILTRRGRSWRTVAGGVMHHLVALTDRAAGGAGPVALSSDGMLFERARDKRWKGRRLPVSGRYAGLCRDEQRLLLVGHRGLLVVSGDKGVRKLASATPYDLLDVWSWGGGAVAVGGRGSIVRIEGEAVRRQKSPSGHTLRGVWGRSASQIVAVGDRGTIVRFDGRRWRAQQSRTLVDLHGVWVDRTSGVAFAAGDAGTVLRWRGGRWREMKTPTAQQLVSIWGRSASSVWAVSQRGTVIHFDGGGWSVERSPATCLAALGGAAGDDGEVLAVGCYGAVLRRAE